MTDDLINRQDAINAFEPDHSQDWYTPYIIEKLESLPSAQPEREILDELMAIMKEYYFTHRYEYNEAWENGFAKCMNLIPNVYEKRKR